MSDVDLGPAAQDLARRGFAVFPCATAGKRPHPRLAPRGFHVATRDPDTIRRWWTRISSANPAIACGASQLAVIDVDRRADGDQTMRRLIAEHGPLGAPAWVETADGWHAYFTDPDGQTPSSTGRIGPGVDVKGQGGYVLAPGAIHPTGAIYQWWRDRPPGVMPAWLRELASTPRVTPSPSPPPQRADGGKRLEGLARVVEDTPPGAGRNHALNWAAYRAAELIAAAEVDEHTVRQRLYQAADACGLTTDPDDGPAAVNRTIDSGLRAGLTQGVAA